MKPKENNIFFNLVPRLLEFCLRYNFIEGYETLKTNKIFEIYDFEIQNAKFGQRSQHEISLE